MSPAVRRSDPFPCAYWVADTQPRGGAVALRDRAGRYHVVLVGIDLPAIGDELAGPFPALGPALLRTASGRDIQSVFELVNCGQQRTLDRLHAPPV